MKTAIVILNWNTADFLRRWIPSILESIKGMDAELIITDNGSTDESVTVLKKEFPSVKRILLDKNYGFTGGYNRALAQIQAEYYLLMNSDIEVKQGWLQPLQEWMDTHPSCGVCGPKLRKLIDNNGASLLSDNFEYAGAAGGFLDRFGFPFCRGRVMQHCEKDNGQYQSSPVMWVSGACMMTRSCLWDRLGGLDERFFAHMEEIDYCWRAQLAGFSIDVVTDSTIWHLGGGTLPQSSAFKFKLNYRNNLLMLEKNLPATIGNGRARARIATRKCLDLASAAVYLIQGRTDLFKSVLDAHKEAKRMWHQSDAQPLTSVHKVAGYWNICIILQSFIRGERIFKYLRDHENSH